MIKIKVKATLEHHEGPEGEMYRWGWGSTPRPGRFTAGKDPVLIV
jgi:hypothetical protein